MIKKEITVFKMYKMKLIIILTILMMNFQLNQKGNKTEKIIKMYDNLSIIRKRYSV